MRKIPKSTNKDKLKITQRNQLKNNQCNKQPKKNPKRNNFPRAFQNQ